MILTISLSSKHSCQDTLTSARMMILPLPSYKVKNLFLKHNRDWCLNLSPQSKSKCSLNYTSQQKS